MRFLQKKALNTHNKVTHLGRRDFVCPHHSCKRAFGYKHLLQRHLGKLHKSNTDTSRRDQSGDAETSTGDDASKPTRPERCLDIEEITGKAYADRAQQKLSLPRALRCPFPDLHGLTTTTEDRDHCGKRCEYVFTRAYDLRRHLRSEHGEDFDKDRVDTWVKSARASKRIPALEG